MITFVIILNFIALFLLEKKIKYDDKLKKITNVFLVFVFCILLISSFNPYELNSVTDKVYLMWIINFDVLFITYIFIMNKYNNKENGVKDLFNESGIENSKVLLIIQIILMILLFYYSIKFYSLARNIEDASKLRMIKFSYLFNSYSEQIIYNYIIHSLYEITSIIFSLFVVNKKFNNPIFIIGVINIILYMTIGYGRMSIYQIAIYIIIAYYLKNGSKTRKKLKFKNIIWGFLIVIIIFSLGIMPTAIRWGIDLFDFKKIRTIVINTQIQQITEYFIGGFRTLDLFIDNGFPDISLTSGRATFGGIDEIIGNVLTVLGSDYKTLNSEIGGFTQETVYIGQNSQFNAFYTCLMNYYLDFGYIGIILGALIHSFLLIIVTSNYIKKKTLISEVLFIFVFMNAFSSIYRWNYQSGSTAMILIFLIILNKKNLKELRNDIL